MKVKLAKLKPSQVLARARAGTTTNGDVPPEPAAPGRPRKTGGGPNPLLVVGVALAAGIVLARLIDSRGHGS